MIVSTTPAGMLDQMTKDGQAAGMLIGCQRSCKYNVFI